MTTEDGFEYKLDGDDEPATFFPWKLNLEGAKDMLIIDSFTQLPIDVFHEKLHDSFDGRRGPFLLAMIGTSIAAKFPDWTVQRIIRLVENLDFSKYAGIVADKAEAGDSDDPPETGEPTNEGSSSPSDESSSSALRTTQTDESPSDTSNLTPA